MANIKKRGNTFKIRAYVGTDMNGKKIIKSTTFVPPYGVSEKKAEKLAQEFAFEYERQCRGYIQFNDSMRFSELADWYFTNYAGVELKDSTIYTYQGQYKNHIEPVLGNMKLKNITTPKLTQVMQSYNLNPATVRKIYVIVQSIFHRAMEQGFIRYNPCQNVILPKNKNPQKVTSLNEEELQRFITLLNEKKWDEDVKRIIRFLLYTGMRSGECFALRWEDINFDKRTIHICHTLNDIGGKHTLTPPKTLRSTRTIYMSDTTEAILREQLEYVNQLKVALGKSYTHPEMVFPSSKGNYRDRNSVLTSLKRFTRGTEFESMTLHKLRHCNATMLLNAGVELKAISDHLGHCDINVTADIYADVLWRLKRNVANAIEQSLNTNNSSITL